jgi:acyl-CoA synthetase (AMP-forming)/AMP-acid ligase II
VSHSLASLTAAARSDAVRNGAAKDAVWGTFYDVRRYGGLQILLRALMGRTSLILPDDGEEAGDFLVRLGRHGVTHLTGTPSHWRRALMSPANLKIAPKNVRLSGEIADQAVLDNLKTRFPAAAIVHVYGSTEAGLGFEVSDGKEGFPATVIGQAGAVEIKLVDGSLHIRSPRAARTYIGGEDLLNEGFVDTGDLVELWGDRFFFVGRRGSVAPEEKSWRKPSLVAPEQC